MGIIEAFSRDKLELMSAQWECEQLIRRYGHLNDAKDYEQLVELFAEDGVLMRPDGRDSPIVGRQAILNFFRSRPHRLSRHLINNPVITVTSETAAQGISYVVLYATISAEMAKGKIPRADRRIIGCFKDKFVNTAEGWRFAERCCTLVMTT